MIGPRLPCSTCGPLPAPAVHDRCHPTPGYRRYGCGHLLVDHTDSLRCRVCTREQGRPVECGIDCDWTPTEHEPDPEPAHEQEALF